MLEGEGFAHSTGRTPMATKPSDLTDDEKHLLEDLYRATPLAVDDLPYTEEMAQIHRDFVARTNRQDGIKDVFQTLKNMGRTGRLGGKIRPRRKQTTGS